MNYCFKKKVTQQFIIFKTCSTLKLNFFIRFHTLKVIGPPGYLNRMVMPHSSADAEIQTNFAGHTGVPFQWDPCYELYKSGEEDANLTPPMFVLWHPKSLQDFKLTKRFGCRLLPPLSVNYTTQHHTVYPDMLIIWDSSSHTTLPGFDTAAEVLRAFADAVPVVAVWWYAMLDILCCSQYGLSIRQLKYVTGQ